MIEEVILRSLLHNDEFLRRVLPYLKVEYFSDAAQAAVFSEIEVFAAKYNAPPTQDELLIGLKNNKDVGQQTFSNSASLVQELNKRSKEPSMDWLVENTETFVQDRALYNALVQAVSVVEEGDKASVLKGTIPDILREALSVSFDTNIGHDFSDYEARYKFLHENIEYRIEFDIDELNKITGGGLPRKTLSVIAATTGAGKSLAMCHIAARAFMKDKKVLYITMEMAEERISERIDANLLGIDLDDLGRLSMQDYTKRIQRVLEHTQGQLIVKEYPTASASVTNFRALLNELRLKKGFVPDLVLVDYINICTSARFKAHAVNSYQYVKAIAEELRGLAIEFNLPIISATQLNRQGLDNSDVGMGEVSESHGLAMTVDALWVMIRSEELDDQNLVMFKQLKNRFSDIASMLRFVVGIDRAKMKLFTSNKQPEMSGSKVVMNGSPPEDSRVKFTQRTTLSDDRKEKLKGLKV